MKPSAVGPSTCGSLHLIAPHGIEPAGKKGDPGRLIGRTKSGMNTKLHAVTDAKGRPISFFMTAGQVSDYTGAAALLDALPKAQ
jgi:hypothetical protein